MSGIYFIGGASASGKSYSAEIFAKDSGLPLIQLDHLARPIKQIKNDETTIDTNNLVREVTWEVLQYIFALKSSCIVEGGWLEPDKASVFRARSDGFFYPVFCGYDDSQLENRYQKIKEGQRHWILLEDSDWGKKFLEGQSELSIQREKICIRKKIPYFDFTDFDSGMDKLSDNFRKWFIDSGESQDKDEN